MSVVEKAAKIAATAGALAFVVQRVVHGEWDAESGRLTKVNVFGIAVFDRRRLEARRARRAARRG